MLSEKILSEVPYPSHYIDIDGSKIHYLAEGNGDPILLLHGIPTSSYIWRNIIPHLSGLGQCIAPDLIGMGKSDKPDIEYSIFDHIRYIEKLIDALNLKNITFIMHGWGSIIGLDYAMRHEVNCKGLIFYEAYLHELSGEYLSLPYQEQLYDLQTQRATVAADPAGFVDQLMSQLVLRPLSEEERRHYRAPFEGSGTSKPLEQYIKEVLPGTNTTVNQLIQKNTNQLMKSTLPKLILYAMPGFITTIAMVMWAKEHFFPLEILDLGEALHCAQETCPSIMGETISIWLQGVEQSVD